MEVLPHHILAMVIPAPAVIPGRLQHRAPLWFQLGLPRSHREKDLSIDGLLRKREEIQVLDQLRVEFSIALPQLLFLVVDSS